MDSVKVKVNGKELQSHNIIFDGRTYLQLRDISNALDKDIGWDGNTSTVSINDKQNNTSMLPSEDIKEINQQTQSNDPKQQFINYIEDFLYREHYDGNAWQIKSGAYKDKWYKFRMITDKDYSYDIQKTDSIVSPYEAIVTFTLKTEKTNIYNTKNEAEADNNYKSDSNDMFYISKYKYHYAYQDGKWMYKFNEYYSFSDKNWDAPDYNSKELDCFGYLAVN